MIDVRKITRTPHFKYAILRLPLEFIDAVGIKERVIIRVTDDKKQIIIEPA